MPNSSAYQTVSLGWHPLVHALYVPPQSSEPLELSYDTGQLAVAVRAKARAIHPNSNTVEQRHKAILLRLHYIVCLNITVKYVVDPTAGV